MKTSTSISFAARFLLGALFVYVGMQKITDPVGFLKAVHAFGLISTPIVLNLVAITLPWIELACGVLLVAGVKARAAALLQLILLIVFTVAVTARALAVYQASDLAFCAIHFDCGCGTGEVPICVKLTQNVALCALAAFVARPFSRHVPTAT